MSQPLKLDVRGQTKHKLTAVEGSLARLEELHQHKSASHEAALQEVLLLLLPLPLPLARALPLSLARARALSLNSHEAPPQEERSPAVQI